MKLDTIVFLLLLSYLLLLVAAYILKVKLLVVTSNSMKPTFEFGDVLLAVSQEHYQPNDIISLTVNGTIVTHRVLSASSHFNDGDFVVTMKYQTKGDANSSPDLGLISHANVIGKVKIIIPKVGYFVLFLQSKFVSISVVFFSLLTLSTQMFFRKFKKNEK